MAAYQNPHGTIVNVTYFDTKLNDNESLMKASSLVLCEKVKQTDFPVRHHHYHAFLSLISVCRVCTSKVAEGYTKI